MVIVDSLHDCGLFFMVLHRPRSRRGRFWKLTEMRGLWN